MEPVRFGKIFNIEKLMKISVPHILEKIYFSLDYSSFKTCLAVSTDWNELLSSERFQKLRKGVFGKEIETELGQALKMYNMEKIHRLVSSNIIDLNYMHKDVGTPLCVAADRGDTDLVQILIEKGAEINARNGYIYSPLYIAAMEGHLDVVKVLLDGGARPDNGAEGGITPVHRAASSGHIEVLKLLLERGAQVNPQVTNTGLTPLHGAAIMGHKDVVKLLLESGADHTMTNLYGDTTRMLAEEYGKHMIGHKDVVDILRQWEIGWWT